MGPENAGQYDPGCPPGGTGPGGRSVPGTYVTGREQGWAPPRRLRPTAPPLLPVSIPFSPPKIQLNKKARAGA